MAIMLGNSVLTIEFIFDRSMLDPAPIFDFIILEAPWIIWSEFWWIQEVEIDWYPRVA